MTTLAPALDERLAAWRRDTPGCAGRIHLNNAGSAFSPLPVTETVQGYLQREQEIGGYEAEDEAAERLSAGYDALASLLGCAPRNVAVVENATVAFSQALSAFDFEPGDRLVTTRHDYSSNQIMYRVLARRRGVQVRVAAELPEGGVDPESVRELAAHPSCRMVALSWIPTNSGLVQDAEAVGEICETLGVPYVLDACQAVGQIPIDPARLRCDYLGGTARKFLRGPRGIGFLYVSDRALARGDYPLGLDMHGAERRGEDGFELIDSARRFENWEFPYALVLGQAEAARYAIAAGIEETGRRAADLAAQVRERLGALPGARVRDRGRRLCAIVTADLAGWDSTALVQHLRTLGINTSAATHEDGSRMVRISPHYYNTQEEIGVLIETLESLSRSARP